MQLIRLVEDYSFGPFDCGEADLRSMPGRLKKRSRSPHSSNISYFCGDEKKERDMTTMQMNAELFRELSVIAEDEGMMEKAIKALRRITSARKKAMSKNVELDENETELPESFKRIRGMGAITQEDIDNDERLAYILSK